LYSITTFGHVAALLRDGPTHIDSFIRLFMLVLTDAPVTGHFPLNDVIGGDVVFIRGLWFSGAHAKSNVLATPGPRKTGINDFGDHDFRVIR
jgi:hypothetical protein